MIPVAANQESDAVARQAGSACYSQGNNQRRTEGLEKCPCTGEEGQCGDSQPTERQEELCAEHLSLSSWGDQQVPDNQQRRL